MKKKGLTVTGAKYRSGYRFVIIYPRDSNKQAIASYSQAVFLSFFLVERIANRNAAPRKDSRRVDVIVSLQNSVWVVATGRGRAALTEMIPVSRDQTRHDEIAGIKETDKKKWIGVVVVVEMSI